MHFPSRFTALASAAFIGLAGVVPTEARASSHMDAPLITFDDPANTTDVYAFLSEDDGVDYLTVALAVYPFEEPGIGPNNYRFDDRVRYDLNIALDDEVSRGRNAITYRFLFKTEFANPDTILQSYLGVLDPAGPGQFSNNQNMRQSYEVRMIDRRRKQISVPLGKGIVPPNNQGLVTPFYNQGDDGDMPAKEGVASIADLDPYTQSAIAQLDRGHRAFAGQRDDGFFADIQSIFDLDFSFGNNTGTPTKPFDSQGGFNVHTIVLDIPLSHLGDAKIAGVYANTDRKTGNKFIQVGRQGNPLFAEALIANRLKDRYNQTGPGRDQRNFTQFARDPELSRLLGVTPLIPGLLEQIFIPDLIKVDLTTGPARLAGQADFNRLGVFGGDVLQSQVQDPFGNGGFIPGGWPNGRRFGDDVLDIAVIALGIAGPGPDFSDVDADRVSANDITYNQVFPYAATPLNGRNHPHH
ncbi:MAG: DUF4331 domain-containing protein [Pseudomonadota bacterium]